jgi:hypothetical protein
MIYKINYEEFQIIIFFIIFPCFLFIEKIINRFKITRKLFLRRMIRNLVYLRHNLIVKVESLKRFTNNLFKSTRSKI